MIDTLSDARPVLRARVRQRDRDRRPGLADGLAPATDRNRFRAVEYLAKIGARGGTEMAEPLGRAVAATREDARRKSARRRAILVLVTDGQVGNEDQILATLGPQAGRASASSRWASTRRSTRRSCADWPSGAGAPASWSNRKQRLDEVMAAIHRRIGTPLLTALFSSRRDSRSSRTRWSPSGCPISSSVAAARSRAVPGPCGGTARDPGHRHGGAGAWSETRRRRASATIRPSRRPGPGARFASSRIATPPATADLGDLESQIVAVSLRHQRAQPLHRVRRHRPLYDRKYHRKGCTGSPSRWRVRTVGGGAWSR